jgi:hypothetical protein
MPFWLPQPFQIINIPNHFDWWCVTLAANMKPELIHEDGQTERTKLTVAFRNFANASQI